MGRGINVPLVIDPITNRKSVTLTLLVISSLVTTACHITNIIIYLYGIYKGVNVTAMDVTQPIYWNLTMAGLYLGRKVTNKDEKQNNENS